MKKFWTEFKAFISKGNVVDLAVAMIIGTAFNKIVSSLVNDVIMPLVSILVGGKSVADWKWVIRPAEYDASGKVLVAESALKYGLFIQALIDFLIIALSVFIIAKVFKASRERLHKISQTIIAETKELTKKQLKALKKLNKKNKKKGLEPVAVIEDLGAEQAENASAVKADAQPKPQNDAPKEAEPKAETVGAVKDEISPAQPQTNAQSTSLQDAELLFVLKEIRDTLKANQTQPNQ